MWVYSQISLLDCCGCPAMPVLPSDSDWEQGPLLCYVFFADHLDAVRVCAAPRGARGKPKPTQRSGAKSCVPHSSSVPPSCMGGELAGDRERVSLAEIMVGWKACLWFLLLKLPHGEAFCSCRIAREGSWAGSRRGCLHGLREGL